MPVPRRDLCGRLRPSASATNPVQSCNGSSDPSRPAPSREVTESPYVTRADGHGDPTPMAHGCDSAVIQIESEPR